MDREDQWASKGYRASEVHRVNRARLPALVQPVNGAPPDKQDRLAQSVSLENRVNVARLVSPEQEEHQEAMVNLAPLVCRVRLDQQDLKGSVGPQAIAERLVNLVSIALLRKTKYITIIIYSTIRN